MGSVRIATVFLISCICTPYKQQRRQVLVNSDLPQGIAPYQYTLVPSIITRATSSHRWLVHQINSAWLVYAPIGSCILPPYSMYEAGTCLGITSLRPTKAYHLSHRAVL
jgi:hypothetical protein